MKKKKEVITKCFSWLLIFLLVIGITPIPVSADDPELWVNGTDILKDADSIVSCGTGTAKWDQSANTLTLTNTVISTASTSKSRNSGIYYSGSDKLNIVLKGNNTIDNNSDQPANQIRYGIYSKHSPLSITGGGKLDITVTSSSITGGGIIFSEGFDGGNDILIQDVTLTGTGRNVKGGLVGICTNAGSIKIQDADISLSGNLNSGIRSEANNKESSGNMTITNSNLSIRHMRDNLIACNKNLTMRNSVLTTEGTTEMTAITVSKDIICSGTVLKNLSSESSGITAMGSISITEKSDVSGSIKMTALYGMEPVTISDSNVNLLSTDNCAVYSQKSISIINHSDLTAGGKISAVRADGDQGITITDSKVKGISQDKRGIESRGILKIDGKSEVIANGGEAAVSAVCTQIAGEQTPGKAILMDEGIYYEENGGKLAVSDWNGQGSSLTSFVAGNEGGSLKQDLSNALKSVSVKIKTVTPPHPSFSH